eukprot:scaffold951_cov118-Isochrysis_galbana.AAC.3
MAAACRARCSGSPATGRELASAVCRWRSKELLGWWRHCPRTENARRKPPITWSAVALARTTARSESWIATACRARRSSSPASAR